MLFRNIYFCLSLLSFLFTVACKIFFLSQKILRCGQNYLRFHWFASHILQWLFESFCKHPYHVRDDMKQKKCFISYMLIHVLRFISYFNKSSVWCFVVIIVNFTKKMNQPVQLSTSHQLLETKLNNLTVMMFL